MSSADRSDVDALVSSLNLELIDTNLYRGHPPYWESMRLFGGIVAAQALSAAYGTIEDIHVHSLHGYFLRPGDPSHPVIYDVDRIRDGRSFATRGTQQTLTIPSTQSRHDWSLIPPMRGRTGVEMLTGLTTTACITQTILTLGLWMGAETSRPTQVAIRTI